MTEDRFGSPVWLTDALQKHFGKFDVDLAAEPWSAVVPRFITEHQNLFVVQPRAKHGYGNWPYGPGQLARFVPFARDQVLEGRIKALTQLVPHYTAEGWWQHIAKPEGRIDKTEWRYQHINHPRLHNWMHIETARLHIDLITVKGRLAHRFPPRYSGARAISRHSSVVVRFVHPDAAAKS